MPASVDRHPSHPPHGAFRVRILLGMVRYHWFIRLRWIMAFAAVVLYGADRLWAPWIRRPWELAAAIVLVALINVAWTIAGQFLLKELQRIEDNSNEMIGRVVLFANAQMAVDLLLLTVILRYSGGIENPMAVFYVFHMLIAALLLRPTNALLQGAWAVASFAVMGFGECLGWFHPHWPFMAATEGATLYQEWGYVLARVGVLGVGVYGTLFFALQIASRLDIQARRLHEANAAIQLLQQRRSRFMQTAAHQLKAPLTGIEMLAGLIRDGVASREQIQGLIGRIIRRCREAIAQVTELLALERIEVAPSERHRIARTDVAEILRRVHRHMADQIASKQLDFSIESAREGAVLAAVDPFDLEICIANLLDNAIRYTPEKGCVRIRLEVDDGTISISVSDTGMGIAGKSKEEMFEPFRRGNQALARNIPGSGLGLAVVKEVVDQAGGQIEVRSSVGAGTTFVVSFPRQS